MPEFDGPTTGIDMSSPPTNKDREGDREGKDAGPTCHSFARCEAILCPENPTELEHVIWYADEAICLARRYQSLPWIRKQKRLARLKPEGYFTYRMLEAIRRVVPGIEGLDPASPLEQARRGELVWIGRRTPPHP